MGDRWIVLELGPKAEGEDPDLIRRSIRHAIKDAEVFIPAAVTTVGEDKVVRYLVEGYAFIRRTQADQIYMRLVGTRYVNSLLMQGRTFATISHGEIERMRSQVRAESEQGIDVGDTVMINSGPYRQLTAVVHEDIPEHDSVQVFIRLRSKEALVTLPRNFLRLVAKAPLPPIDTRAEGLVAWFEAIWPVTSWRENEFPRILAKHAAWSQRHKLRTRAENTGAALMLLDRIDKLVLPELPNGFRKLQKEHARVSSWLQRREWIDRIAAAKHFVLDLSPVKKTFTHFRSVRSLDDRLRPLSGFMKVVTSNIDTTTLPKFETRYMEYVWLVDVIDRIRDIGEEVDMIETQAYEDVDLDTERPSPRAIAGDVDNFVIDGLNLAVRCFYAPGLSELKDSQGRPTGVYYGFLNSLSSFRRRFPEAHLHIVWDGSSKRRREVFAGYKASRGHAPVSFDQVAWLRGTLPLLGVSQSWHPEEEADDVMGTLVSGPLLGKRNVLFTSDRDMLQLVSRDTIWMTPAVGKAKETAYNPKLVREKWGVDPENIVLLRALLGDTSDEIPGVGIPQKIAVNLVNAYKTVDRIYDSKLAGLSKLQYDKLRAAESTVRRNVGLMKLQCDLPLTSVPAKPDQTAAEQRLRDADVKPDNILAAFFGDNVKTN